MFSLKYGWGLLQPPSLLHHLVLHTAYSCSPVFYTAYSCSPVFYTAYSCSPVFYTAYSCSPVFYTAYSCSPFIQPILMLTCLSPAFLPYTFYNSHQHILVFTLRPPNQLRKLKNYYWLNKDKRLPRTDWFTPRVCNFCKKFVSELVHNFTVYMNLKGQSIHSLSKTMSYHKVNS